MEPLGAKLRRQRRRLGLTLDELAGRTGISKPYLSLIETGRVPNPPSDEKIRRLEQTLGFPTGELISQAHLQRTPRDVRAMLGRLIEEGRRNQASAASEHRNGNGNGATALLEAPGGGGAVTHTAARAKTPAGARAGTTASGLGINSGAGAGTTAPACGAAGQAAPSSDDHLAQVLQEMAQQPGGATEAVAGNVVPVVNRAAAGYPVDFTDLSYATRAAHEFVGCPDVSDKDAFAARVHGDSMTPQYREGDIVIFAPGSTPRSGDDCFVRFDDGRTTFKRIFFETDQDAATSVLRLQPRNESHRAQVVPAQRVAGLYKAVYKYQRVEEE